MSAARISTRTFIWVALAVAAVLAGAVSLAASGSPDGLEFVAGRLGFDAAATPHLLAGLPTADYVVGGVSDARISGAAAGLLGCAVVAAAGFGLDRLLRRGATD
ncbi:cobalt/nickel transport protein [Mumia flava]|uniref:Cobalt/nickel transport protein n=1 Tax=Mumia flava TaxID=1348852 RepID=A0A0B2BKZ5_9ACTN|nr:PDGLE domain-containing protein [Mumia flava]PJJ56376.1 cobalt/nickel transport protein [Mumia flava]